MVVFNYEYWRSEVQVFDEKFADPASDGVVLVACLRGICWVASEVILGDPAHKDAVLTEYRRCLGIALDRMGSRWLSDHALIIATHGPDDE